MHKTNKMMALTGNEAGAYAMKQIDPDVVPAYPITPQTELMQTFAGYVADGQVRTELILVESEHSAMSAAVGAAAAGARVMVATSANGLALMWEVVYIAASSRLPIAMAVVNRALSAPINIHCDHSDSMGCRDTGWIQLYGENSQEVYDNFIQALKISEHKDVLLPVMATHDGFIISHTVERVDTLADAEVKEFVGDYHPRYPLLDIKHPVTYGPLDLQDYYMEHKKQQAEAMKKAKRVILEVGKEYGELSGRSYGLFDEYYTEDADYIVVALGSTAGTAKAAVDVLREKGEKVGVLKLRVFRPFPAPEIARVLSQAKAVAVLDRSEGFSGIGGPVFQEVRSALYRKADLPVSGYVYGLGGRDITPEMVAGVFNEMKKGKIFEEEASYLGLRE